MSFRISNILDYDTFLAIDIWAFKIKVLVCKIDWQELKIIWSSTLRQSKKDMYNGEITDISSISKSIQKAVTKACQSLDSIPTDALVLLNSSELIYDFTSINYVRKWNNSPIGMKEIDEMIEDVEIRSLDKIKTKTESRLWIIEAEMKLVTTSITWIYVDGQRITNPIGFTGKNIKFNIINVFSPVSRFMILKNIIHDLWLNLISVVPLPISLPKLIEDSPYNYDNNIYLDIWYSKTTVILQSNSEILWFNILNFWYSLLEDELRSHLDKSYLDIENILWSLDEKYEEYKEIVDWALNFIFDSMVIAIQDIEKTFFAKNVFVSWAWVSEVLKKGIAEHFEKNHIGKHITVVDEFLTDENLKEYNNNAMLWAVSLAKAGKELMAIKKDPLVRILRYVLYKYE
ncbi:MAG: cell division protein (septum formation) [uncultured bacterium (gcode 4)]|uniref:Cell division protein (Septum formation) n=1 Tax=uncultured bacterium (gcode 4) TaxID=1234023 RepID=K2GZV5_9BACT|nr:MAG: cell division protein (septum formation) [uncultured bacterium (gcode 4)]